MRVRSHQNPFAVNKQFQQLNIRELFPHPNNTLVVEIGFAGGAFLLDYSQRNPATNFVGLEIRKLLVDVVSQRITELRLENVHIEHANANSALCQLFNDHLVDEFFIFFPDPWIKKRHLKRRLVNAGLVKDIVRILKPGGEVFIQSDVAELAEEIRDHFEATTALTNMFGARNWATENHTGSITERESYCIEDGTPIYRLRYKKQPIHS